MKIRKLQTTDKPMTWICPKCGEYQLAPAIQTPCNPVVCECGWEGKWEEVKVKF